MNIKLILLINFFLLSFLCLGQDSNSGYYTGPIIDMHLHAYNKMNPLFGEMVNPTTGEKRIGSSNPENHKKQTFEKLKKHKIVKAMISAGDGDNTVSLDWKDTDPQRFIIGQVIVNPYQTDFDKLRKKFKNNEFEIIGEVMPNYAGILPTDPGISQIFEFAAELNIPIAYHLFPGGPPGGAYFAYPHTRAHQAKPLQMEELLISYPNVKIYIMHAGWPYLDDMKALMYAHPQVYVDLGVICWYLPRQEFQQYLKGLVDAGYSKRIMFGSDQMTWPDEISNGIEAINSADFLTLDQKADIFYYNAHRFLNLSNGDQ